MLAFYVPLDVSIIYNRYTSKFLETMLEFSLLEI